MRAVSWVWLAITAAMPRDLSNILFTQPKGLAFTLQNERARKCLAENTVAVATRVAAVCMVHIGYSACVPLFCAIAAEVTAVSRKAAQCWKSVQQ